MFGAILVTLGLSFITYAFIESPKSGFGDPLIIASLIIGVLGLAAFFLVQYYSKHPMMPLNLFRSATFTGSNTLTLFVYAALGGAMFFLPLNLIQIQGYSELSAGMALLPIIILIATISPMMGRFVDRRGVRLPLIIGPLITSAGFFIFSTYGITSGVEAYWQTFFLSLVLIGIGMGITVAPLTTAVMGAVSTHNAGVASGINNTLSRVAGVLALALLGAMVLFSFNESMEIKINDMDISSTLKAEIMLESSKFAAAKIPSELTDAKRIIVDGYLKESFIIAFNKVAYIASFLTFMGSIMAVIFIRKKKPIDE